MDKIVKIIEAAADLLDSRKDITSPEIYALELAKEVAKLAVLAERQACAKVCEAMHEEDRPSDYAYAIRARSNATLPGYRAGTELGEK